MVQINFAQKSVTVKIVYYGPGMSGKTTNLEIVHERAPEESRGDLTSISTDGDRTLFFDFMPLDLGTVAGMRTQFQIYTVPGQVYYNSTRKLVLQGVDGVIFIADSGASMMEENLESLRNLEENLEEYGKSMDTVPMVIQYNKRDLPDALPVDQLDAALNPHGVPTFEGIANTGQGVFPTLKALAALVLDSIHEQSGTGASSSSAAAPAPAPVAASPPVAGVPAPALAQAPAPASPPVAGAPGPAPLPVAGAPGPAPTAPAPSIVQAPAPQLAPTPAAPAVTQGGTGFYPASAVPPAAGVQPPVQTAGTGFYPAQVAPQPAAPVAGPAPAVPAAPGPELGVPQPPVPAPQQQPGPPLGQPGTGDLGGGVPQGFPQPGTPPPFVGAPEGMPQAGPAPQPYGGQEPVPQVEGPAAPQYTAQQQPGFPEPQTGTDYLRMAAMQVGGSTGEIPSRPAPAAPLMHSPQSFTGAPPPAGRAMPVPPQTPPRIKPRANALPTPNSGGGNSALITTIFVLVALAAGIGVGGFAFGLF